METGKCYRVVDVRANHSGPVWTGKPGYLTYTLVPEMEVGTNANIGYTYSAVLEPHWEVVPPDDLNSWNSYKDVSHDKEV